MTPTQTSCGFYTSVVGLGISEPSTVPPFHVWTGFFLSRNASGTWRSLMTRRRRFFAAHFRSPSFFSSATFFTKAVDDHFQKWPKTKLWKSWTKSVAGMFPRIYLTEKTWIWKKTKESGFNDCPRTWLKYANATTAEQRLQPPCKKDLQNVNAGRKLKIPQLWPEHRPQHVLQTDVDWLDDQQTDNI